MKTTNPTKIQIALAWLVHLFTAFGLVAGFLSILAINAKDWRMAMLWLIVAGIIDGIDGTFARMLNISEVLPQVKGSMIDTVVDFVNYTVVPAYFLYSANVFPTEVNIMMPAIILVVSALYYGKEGMVSEDMYFVGFPVLWNVIAFYLIFVSDLPEVLNAIVIVIFSVLHFLPLKFAYPSRKSKFQKFDLSFAIIMFVSMLGIVFLYPTTSFSLCIVAYICATYFMGMAIYNTYVR